MSDLESMAAAAEEALQSAGKAVLELLKPRPGPRPLFYHQSFAIWRVQCVSAILRRLSEGGTRLASLAAEECQLRRDDHAPGKPYGPRMQAVLREHGQLTTQMQLDMESLYVFGSLLLDQWAHFVAYLLGLPKPKTITFHRLVATLEDGGVHGPATALWERFGPDMLWLTHQIRFYRNRFVVHVDRPWQRGSTHWPYGGEFRLFIPSPPGWLDDDRLAAEVQALIHLAPKWLQEQPEDYWERARPRALLGRLFDNIGSVERKEDREAIARLVGEMGITTPSFQGLGAKLLSFVAQASTVACELARENSQGVDLG